ncbi:unnamed protein product [Haemonchus placei]|uniref:Integrase catalytic domain-containing protein n=1 Tax=Haemonchus placei TaxID=6290 RepID=A0A0N4WSS6_HAEPC|nr:unnamed protein product [Haemonchus placei]
MNLREFLCNSSQVNQAIAAHDRILNPSNAKLLGIRWLYERDEIAIQIRISHVPVQSKRTALQFEDQNIAVKFHYVASGNNPADCATRGLATKEAKSHIWWTGPQFLYDPPDQWPNATIDFTIPPQGEEVQLKQEEVHVIRNASFISVLPFTVTNNYYKLLRITSYVLKFLRRQIFNRVSNVSRNTLASKLPALEAITSSVFIQKTDIDTAEILLILAHYRESETVLQRLKLETFNARRAQDDLIRCPARVGPLDDAPVLLIPSHRLTQLIILHYHHDSHHSGVYHVIANLRKRFFIPSIRNCVAKVLRNCVSCKKVNGHAYRYPNLPQLPPERVTRSRPFQNIGLDYLGPINVYNSCTVLNKTWVCLITCMATRAVHLELVLDNSTREFLLAFRRFIARRGTPDLVYSDNSTTFHAAESAIMSVLYSPKSWESITDYCVKHKITWKFITPLSPWKGGFYERLVALFKTAYKKSVGQSTLSLSQLQTVVTEIEATINSRPIIPYRETNAFAYVLRPVDFLSPTVNIQLPPLSSQPDPILDISNNLAHWYKETLTILDQFWEIWHAEYLSALRQRQQARLQQRKYSTIHPQIGDIVIVADDKLPRGHWPYGLIEKLHVGKDQSVRSADVRMPNGKVKTRSLTQLYPLELRAASTTTHSEPLHKTITPQRLQPRRLAKTTHKFIKNA